MKGAGRASEVEARCRSLVRIYGQGTATHAQWPLRLRIAEFGNGHLNGAPAGVERVLDNFRLVDDCPPGVARPRDDQIRVGFA